MTSVAMKIHMPNAAASRCWRRVSKCSARACALTMLGGRGERALWTEVVIVRAMRDHRSGLEVVRGGWRRRQPLERGAAPGIGAGPRAPPQRPQEIDQR